MPYLPTFTLIHALISIVALLAGLLLMLDEAAGRSRPRVDLVFLVAAIVTSVSGFGFPYARFLPSHALGVLSLIALAAALAARRRGTHWRTVYITAVAVSVYFLAFVSLVQAFLKLPPLHALAPTQDSPAFIAAQVALLAAFIVLGLRSLHGAAPAATTGP